MARYAQVHSATGFVTNVIVIEDAVYEPPVGYEMVPDPDSAASPGYTYADGTFTPPPTGEAEAT
jgi:hypothetical protein